ncbi:transcription initiation factor TFIID subunit 6-like [Chenopodium quinoa]|uniref:transcription initiation factor TFIID subunit 6-like n=1 Tax=Chenopodium quinoa TaxID=63459 RepID=UPI000B76E970|nr:transcription initiation factor TFIID subunit 6-like [Chenopodium quinoa]XP_021759051.1 transcription initiation factor TFIID subunit 6-like [Chenopodium quinoa]
MSVIQKETIEVIAQSIGINNLSPDVALALAPDVEYRVREIMQEAIKCMRHSKRTILTADDVDAALNLRNVEPIYGFASNDPLRFKRAAGQKDLFYVNDIDLDLKNVTEVPVPRAPLDTSLSVHWLAIEGVQPAIPENPPVEALAASSDGNKLEFKEEGIPIDIKLPVKHVLSRELQLYFDKVIELTTCKSDTVLFKEALRNLATDSGLHPLVPYFACFIGDEVSRNLNKLSLLTGLMRLVWSLLQNPHIHVEPYVHQLMPSVITCLVAKRLGNRYSDNHWELRNLSANLVARVCQRFGHIYHNLQPRVTRTLLHAFLDPKKALPQHYGAIQGLAALGPSVVRLLILPNLEPYIQLLGPEMQLEGQKNEIRRQEAWRVYGALLFASGKCMHDQLKKFPSLPLPLARPILKSNKKIVTMLPSKRKASADNLLQQPPLKKLSTNGAMGVMPVNSMQANIQGIAGVFSAAVGGSDAGLSAISQQLQNENVSGSSGRRDKTDIHAKKASALALAWKEETDGGRLLSSLFEHFGISMFSFTPSPELSLFL